MGIVTDGIACPELLESRRGANVASFDKVDGILLVGVHLVQADDTLFLAGTGVEHLVAGIEAA